MKSQIKGVIPPLTTPFTKDEEVYEEGLRRVLMESSYAALTVQVHLCLWSNGKELWR